MLVKLGWLLTAALTTALGGLSENAANQGLASGWSLPAPLGDCPGAGKARAVFPSNGPHDPTGPGAVIFDDSGPCSGPPGVAVAVIGQGEVPTTPHTPASPDGRPISLAQQLGASGGPHGEVVIASSTPTPAAGAQPSGPVIQ